MRILAIGLEPQLAEVVASVAAREALAFEVVTREAANVALESVDDLLAIVLGGRPDPMRIVRRCYAAAPEVPVAILADAAQCAAVREAMRYSPIGREVHCLAIEPPDLPARIAAAVDRARRRGATLQTMAALNRRIDTTVAPTRTAAVLLGRVLDLAPIGVAILDRDAIVRELNPRATSLLDLDDALLVGRPLWVAFAEADRERLTAMLSGFGHDGGARGAFDRGGRRIDLSGAPLTAAAGGPGYLVVLEDVTEHHTLVTELEAANRRKDEFLAMLGHELRNPLAPIQSAVDLLKARALPAIEREREVIERQLANLTQLIDDLLDISRITRGLIVLERVRVGLDRLVDEAVEIVQPLIRQRRHTLNVDVPRGLDIEADPRRVLQIITNLLTNAARYTDPGGTITVTAGRRDPHVVLSVRDTGRGIPPELLRHVFEPFVQNKQSIDRAAGGLGLGLAIVHSLVGLHGGSVSVTSEVGTGSELIVNLPAAAPATVTPEPVAPPPPPARAVGKPRILVVDDNQDAASLITDLLAMLGYEADVVHDGPAAISRAPEFHPRLVLLDIGLPGMDGCDVARHLARMPELADTKLVALTGYGQIEDRRRTEAAGFHHHLVKPVSVAQLRELLASYLG